MQKITFNRKITGQFTAHQLNLAYNQEELLPFISQSFSKENILQQLLLKQKNYSAEMRQMLVKELTLTYSAHPHTEQVTASIEALKESTAFTVTTGHQLSLFTGPIYFIYKIIHTIRLAEELRTSYPEYNFIPVFWMASEDHDFEEIQTVELFGKKITWENEQQGAVGRFTLDGMDALKQEVVSFFQHQPQEELLELLETYSGKNLGEATFRLVNQLFGKYGLIVLDGDNATYKSAFAPTLEKELTEQFSFKAVQATNAQLEQRAIKLQLTPREINLFYLDEQKRERIKAENEQFLIEGKGAYTLEELLKQVRTNPAAFSPNVVLRPVFQETILPNLCYVGGVGEISYWLQLKGVFDALSLTYPLVQARTSVLWIDAATTKKMEKLNLEVEQLFSDPAQVKKDYLKQNATAEIDFSAIDQNLQNLKDSLVNKLIAVDPSLEKYAYAEAVKLEKHVESLKEKMVKATKQRHENTFKAIDSIYARLFPNGGLQERSLNLFTLCANGQIAEKIELLHQTIDPFDPDFVVLCE